MVFTFCSSSWQKHVALSKYGMSHVLGWLQITEPRGQNSS
jgi:hypothetical protein